MERDKEANVARNITSRRKLSDLYAVGVEVRFGPGPDGRPIGSKGPFLDETGKRIVPGDDEVAMWLQPPSPLQREMALRDAQASRARALIKVKRDEDSQEHLSVAAFLSEMDDVTLVDYLLLAGSDTRQDDAVRDVLSRDEWSDISALQDAMRQYDDEQPDAEDPEYLAVMERDAEYGKQVRARQMELLEAAREGLNLLSRENLEKRAAGKRAEVVGSQAFVSEYERQMLFYAIRDVDDHKLLFFESAKEMSEQDDEVQALLADTLANFIREANEAKNSPRVASGSPSSEPPSKPETSEASTPEAVSV